MQITIRNLDGSHEQVDVPRTAPLLYRSADNATFTDEECQRVDDYPRIYKREDPASIACYQEITVDALRELFHASAAS